MHNQEERFYFFLLPLLDLKRKKQKAKNIVPLPKLLCKNGWINGDYNP